MNKYYIGTQIVYKEVLNVPENQAWTFLPTNENEMHQTKGTISKEGRSNT